MNDIHSVRNATHVVLKMYNVILSAICMHSLILDVTVKRGEFVLSGNWS